MQSNQTSQHTFCGPLTCMKLNSLKSGVAEAAVVDDGPEEIVVSDGVPLLLVCRRYLSTGITDMSCAKNWLLSTLYSAPGKNKQKYIV